MKFRAPETFYPKNLNFEPEFRKFGFESNYEK